MTAIVNYLIIIIIHICLIGTNSCLSYPWSYERKIALYYSGYYLLFHHLIHIRLKCDTFNISLQWYLLFQDGNISEPYNSFIVPFFFLELCCGFSKNGHLNPCSPFSDNVWEGLGGMVFREKVCHWGWAMPCHFILCLHGSNSLKFNPQTLSCTIFLGHSFFSH